MVSLTFNNLRFMKKLGMLLLVFIGVVSCKNEIKNTTENSILLIDSTQVRKHLYTLALDEVETLDIAVIIQTIQAVAFGTQSIISGEDTPTRVVVEERKNN